MTRVKKKKNDDVLADYIKWFDDALHGHKTTYYSGDLQYDRSLSANKEFNSGLTQEEIERISLVDRLGKRVYRDYLSGSVELFQRKNATNHYDYIAIRLRDRTNRPEGVIIPDNRKQNELVATDA